MRFLRRNRPERAVKPAYPTRPRLEQLEDRSVPSIVTNTSGSDTVPGSLPYEVANAPFGDTIQFAASLNGATITLNNMLDINKNLKIDGTGTGITVNGGGNRVFQIEPGTIADIFGLTITGGGGPGLGGGGGIYNFGSLTLVNSTVAGNTALEGGGIFNNNNAKMVMSADTVNGNTADDTGGGIVNRGQLTITNCTIANNAAVNFGGGIANDGVLMMTNSTVASNVLTLAGADGGGIYTFGAGSLLALLNTIVFNPSSGAATHNDVLGTIAQAQGNLFGSSVNIAAGGDLGGNQQNVSPLLGPLRNNGGPTATMALLANSPVGIGQGVSTSQIPVLSVPFSDQRGYARTIFSEDVGAVQTQNWVVADFVGQGVQAYVFGSWHALSPFAAQSVAVDGAGDVVASFAGAGLWRWTLAAGWTPIDSFTPQSFAVDQFGQITAAFAGGGLWYWAGSWTQIDSYTPQSIAAYGDGGVVAAFANGGVWRFIGGTWTQIDGVTPQSLAVDGAGDVVASFAGGGLWRWTPASGWTQIDGVTPQQIAMDAAGDVFATFAGGGLWRWTLASGWTQIDNFTPQQIAADADGDVVAAFGDGTLWRWLPGNTWTKLIPGPVDALGASQF
jgi:hypothetical protein